MAQDVETCVVGIRSYIKSALQQNQCDAIISFAFNVGNNAFMKSTLLKVINVNPQEFTAIRTEWMKWDKAGGKTLSGLTRRREMEYNLYCQKTI